MTHVLPKLSHAHVHVLGELAHADGHSTIYECCLICESQSPLAEGKQRFAIALQVFTGMCYGQGMSADEIHTAVTKGLAVQAQILRAHDIKPAT